ncbi:50S ribosomal protein L25 [Candidatus Riflebacteria bacterium]
MELVPLKAIQKQKHGSSISRKLRKEGWLPSMVTGHDSGSIPLAVEKKTFSDTVNQSGELIPFAISMDGQDQDFPVLIKEIQRDPIKDCAIHCDFQIINEDRAVEVSIPVNLVGVPKGARKGGILQHKIRKLRISTLPKNIPQFFEIDINELDIGEGIEVKTLFESYPDLTFLGNPNARIVSLIARSASEIKAAEHEAKIASGEIVEGEEESSDESKDETEKS